MRRHRRIGESILVLVAHRSRMLKKAPNFVLGLLKSSKGTPPASLEDLFEHPARIFHVLGLLDKVSICRRPSPTMSFSAVSSQTRTI
jgi:hypothetical protein